MKFRSDFVTNSSSSSFLLAFQSKEDGIAQISDMTKRYGSDYIGTLLKDFIDAEPLRMEDVRERFRDDIEGDVEWDMSFGRGGWGTGEFRLKWFSEHPGATGADYYESEERKKELERRMDAEFKRIEADIVDLSYLVELEYEDHSDAGSELEHEILPCQSFTVRRFNRH